LLFSPSSMSTNLFHFPIDFSFADFSGLDRRPLIYSLIIAYWPFLARGILQFAQIFSKTRNSPQGRVPVHGP
ncbi:hypothetical protein, partial [Pseudoflavonifractor sp. 60]|uniref:hypothetical protein n=1 Tax=Pseudoflavonifractor sp. 60 TaxID=2304576 RepID=UPI001A9AC0CF